MSRVTINNSVMPLVERVNSIQNRRIYNIRNSGYSGLYNLNYRIPGKGTGENEAYYGTSKEVYSYLKGMLDLYYLK